MVQRVARRSGAVLTVGRRKETVSPLVWDPPYVGSQRSLVPDLILTFDPEDLFDAEADPQRLIKEYRKWAEAVRSAVEDGLESW